MEMVLALIWAAWSRFWGPLLNHALTLVGLGPGPHRDQPEDPHGASAYRCGIGVGRAFDLDAWVTRLPMRARTRLSVSPQAQSRSPMDPEPQVRIPAHGRERLRPHPIPRRRATLDPCL